MQQQYSEGHGIVPKSKDPPAKVVRKCFELPEKVNAAFMALCGVHNNRQIEEICEMILREYYNVFTKGGRK